jgi:septum site-determining protein MinC
LYKLEDSYDKRIYDKREFMNELVLIKGNRYGLNVILDAQADFDVLEEAFVNKLTDGRKFFGFSKISINFEGREMTTKEQQRMVTLIHELTDMQVFCVIDETIPVVRATDLGVNNVRSVTETITKHIIPKEAAVFHQGTLRSGQEIDVNTGIVVLGDVNPGAKVTAKGNIIILGSLKGYAHAGNDGGDHACVVALNMQPTQIRISQVIARSPDKFKDGKTEPQIAFLEEGRIVIDEILSNVYKDFKLLN